MSDLDFGLRVRTRRRFLGISQDGLAKAVGISQPAIKKIEAGGQTRHGRKVAGALNTTLQWLETGVDATVDSNGSRSESPTGTHQHAIGAARAANELPHDHTTNRVPPPWPLKKSTVERIKALAPAQQKKLDDMIDAVLKGFEAEGK